MISITVLGLPQQPDIWKFHFLAGISGVYLNLPLHLWCCLLPQATQTLNLLCRSRINLRLSAEAQLNGKLYYNRTPMAPPETKVLIHETLQHCCTWDFHSNISWYIGTAPLHYQCYRIYIPETRGECIAKIVHFFFPQRNHARYVFRRRGHRRSHSPS